MSLLEEAKRHAFDATFDPEEIELACAYVRGEVTVSQVTLTLQKLGRTRCTSVYPFVARAIRYGIIHKVIKIDEFDR